MKLLKQSTIATIFSSVSMFSLAHYPYVAPMSYQTFNNYTAIVSGFYDNPFSPEIAIKNFKFHYHQPNGEKIYLTDADWTNAKALSSFALENKQNGTYRIRGEKQGNSMRYALHEGQWKALMKGEPAKDKPVNTKVVYESQLAKKSKIKTVTSSELIETFVSRKEVSKHVIHHIHDGFDVQFITHPNAIKQNQPVQFKILDNKLGVANIQTSILAQTHDYGREAKAVQNITSNEKGELNFSLKDKGQYLLVIDYQQPFTLKNDDLKRYKYTLAFNVVD